MPKRKYSIAFKQEVLDYMATGKTGYAAWKYFCERDNILYTQSMFNKWHVNRDRIQKQAATGDAHKCRIKGGGRKPLLAKAEELIRDEINDILEKRPDFKVTRQYIASLALDIANSIGLKGFQASSHWIRLFMTRNGFELMNNQAFLTMRTTCSQQEGSESDADIGISQDSEAAFRDIMEQLSTEATVCTDIDYGVVAETDVMGLECMAEL